MWAESTDRNGAIVISLMQAYQAAIDAAKNLLLHCCLRSVLRGRLSRAGGVLQTVCFRHA